MSEFERKVKLNIITSPGITLILECGHSFLWLNSETEPHFNSSYLCKKCKSGININTDWVFEQNTPANISADISEYEKELERLLKLSRKTEKQLARLVMHNRSVKPNEHKRKALSILQNEFLALSYDIVLSGQIFRENYTKGLTEHNQKMLIQYKLRETSQNEQNQQSSYVLTDLMERTSIQNPLNLPFLHRIGNSAKALLFWLRSFQDVCAKLIIVTDGSLPGEFTSMNRAISKENNPTYKFVRKNSDYIP